MYLEDFYTFFQKFEQKMDEFGLKRLEKEVTKLKDVIKTKSQECDLAKWIPDDCRLVKIKEMPFVIELRQKQVKRFKKVQKSEDAKGKDVKSTDTEIVTQNG